MQCLNGFLHQITVLGEIQYRTRLEDIRLLKLEIKKLRREKNILSKSVANVEDLRYRTCEILQNYLIALKTQAIFYPLNQYARQPLPKSCRFPVEYARAFLQNLGSNKLVKQVLNRL